MEGIKEKIDKILDDAEIDSVGAGWWITNQIELTNKLHNLFKETIDNTLIEYEKWVGDYHDINEIKKQIEKFKQK